MGVRKCECIVSGIIILIQYAVFMIKKIATVFTSILFEENYVIKTYQKMLM